ncbi:MAG TPA: putative quinol monooxygenase [Rhodopila sp.]|nr:putative quinol monooxygenase [Rhodopila sp.]
MTSEIAVVAIAEAKPGLEAEVEAAIRPCVAATRNEAGCHLYTVHTEIDHPNRFVFIERWASRAALAAHEKEPHFLAMAKAFETRLTAPLQVLILRELA